MRNEYTYESTLPGRGSNSWERGARAEDKMWEVLPMLRNMSVYAERQLEQARDVRAQWVRTQLWQVIEGCTLVIADVQATYDTYREGGRVIMYDELDDKVNWAKRKWQEYWNITERVREYLSGTT